jgi:hypothetical protein
LIEEFKQGHLPLKEGTSLRSFLAKMVHCNPKRISKKFEGSDYQGKRGYENSNLDLNPQEAQMRRAQLQVLENQFEESVKGLQEAEDSRNAALSLSLAVSAPSFDSVNLVSSSLLQRQRTLLGGNNGLPGRIPLTSTESSWLLGAIRTPGGMNQPRGTYLSKNGLGMDMGRINPTSRAIDLALVQGQRAALMEPSPFSASSLNAAYLGDLVRLKNNLAILMGRNSSSNVHLSDASLSMTNPYARSFLGVANGMHSGRGQHSVVLPSAQENVFLQQMAPVPYDELAVTRRVLLSPGSMMGPGDQAGSAFEVTKKRRL